MMTEEVKKHPIYLMCSQISGYCYDSAQFLAEKERDATKSSNPPVAGLMSAFVKICATEKQYFSLSFLLPKRFFMKDTSLKAGYVTIYNDLKKVEEWRSSKSTREMANQLMQFIEARQQLLYFYETVATTAAVVDQAEKSIESLSKNIDTVMLPIGDILHPIIAGIVKKYGDCMSNELLKPLNDLLMWELESLRGLFSCFHHMNHWRYYESLTEIDSTKRALSSWLYALQTITEIRTSRFSSWFGTGRASPVAPKVSTPPSEDIEAISEELSENSTSATEVLHNYVEPTLYSWLSKMRGFALSKLTLYFFDVLAKQSSRERVIENCVKLAKDIPGQMISAQNRFEISYIVMIFDARKEVGFKGPGFHHPEITKDTVRGMDQFPCAFSWPECPKETWPMIVMTMDENDHALDTTNKIVPVYDGRADIGYALIRIEHNMTLIIISQGKRPERDAAITGFMVEIAVQLRGNKNFASVKPGYK